MAEGKHDVFLSYASEDLDIANRIRTELEKEQYSVWMDASRILAGDNFVTEIFSAIQNSRYFLIVLSSHSTRSDFVREEYSAAWNESIKNAEVTVIPILYESCPIPSVLRQIHHVDFTKSPETALRDLVDTIHAHERRRKGEPANPVAQPTLGGEVDKLSSRIRGAEDLYLVTDVGGTKAYVSVMTRDGDRLFDRKFTTQSQGDPSGLLNFLAASIDDTIHGVCDTTTLPLDEVEGKIKAYGIAFAGPTDSVHGVVRDASNFQIKDYPLQENLRKRLRKPVFIENDANLGVLGESWKGVARAHRNVLGIVIGTGIGGGIVIDGQLYRGSTSTAGEIGHIVIDETSQVICGCRQRGCFEALASRRAIARELHRRKKLNGQSDLRWDEKNLGSAQLADYVKHGDTDAIEVLQEAVGHWAKAVFSLLNILNPDIIFFGGGFIRQLHDILGDGFLDPVRSEAERCMNAVYESAGKKVPIVVGELDNPMLSGACLLAIRGRREPSSKEDIMRALTADISARELDLLQSIYEHSQPTIISKDPGSDFHEDQLRNLRNRGLIATPDGLSFRRSRHVEITRLGRMAVEDRL
jgi:glucokinase